MIWTILRCLCKWMRRYNVYDDDSDDDDDDDGDSGDDDE